jgi:hypothetical protein
LQLLQTGVPVVPGGQLAFPSRTSDPSQSSLSSRSELPHVFPVLFGAHLLRSMVHDEVQAGIPVVPAGQLSCPAAKKVPSQSSPSSKTPLLHVASPSSEALLAHPNKVKEARILNAKSFRFISKSL